MAVQGRRRSPRATGGGRDEVSRPQWLELRRRREASNAPYAALSRDGLCREAALLRAADALRLMRSAVTKPSKAWSAASLVPLLWSASRRLATSSGGRRR